jgi:hypothetical protein
VKLFVPLILIGALPLAACDQKTGSTTLTTNAATGEVKATSTGSGVEMPRLQPGKWELKTQVSELKMSNMPKGANPTPPAQTASLCITAEQAAKGPTELLKNAGSDCTITSNSFKDGKIETDLTCKMPGDMTMKSRTTGTFTATSFSTDQQMEVTGAHSMSQKVHTDARRVGVCDTK